MGEEPSSQEQFDDHHYLMCANGQTFEDGQDTVTETVDQSMGDLDPSNP